MAWEKIGLIFNIKKYDISWLKSHAMLPTPLLLDDRIRVYYTGRDENGHSRISFVDLDREDPTKIIYVHPDPILEVGKLGAFDDSGMLCTCTIKYNDKIFLYYNGYNIRVTVPYTNAIGVLVSEDGVNFKRIFKGPILDRWIWDPFFCDFCVGND